MKKIIISSNTCWYLYNFRRNTINTLINEGYSVYALAPQDSYSENLKKLGCNLITVKIDQSGVNPFKDLKSLLTIRRIYKKHKPDIVLNFTPKNNIYGTLAAKGLNHIFVINNIAGLGSVFINESFISKIARLLYKISQKRANKIFFQNEDDRDLFLNNKIASHEITDRLPGSGVDLNRFKISFAPNDGIVRFLLIARMLYDKGVLHYVDAARELKSKYGDRIEFRLLGFLDSKSPSAIQKEQMDCWVNEGIVTYLGITDSVEDEIAKVDCVVLPSFYREGVPKSLLEAGAMGKPIITTDNVGCRETVDHNLNGYICEPKSTESLMNYLDVMYHHSHDERIKMGLCSRVKIEKEFDEKIILDKYLSAIKEV